MADNIVSELYRIAGLVPLMITARIAALFDNKVVDGLVDGLATSIRGVGQRLRFAQRGHMQENLAFSFAVAAVLILAFVFYWSR
jgi:multicomponent Na+:H+ antiporter subunit D